MRFSLRLKRSLAPVEAKLHNRLAPNSLIAMRRKQNLEPWLIATLMAATAIFIFATALSVVG